MKRLILIAFIVVTGLALLGAAPAPSPESLLEEADKALRQGEFTRAINLYEQLEPRAEDPGLITLRLGQAKYERAVKDNSANDYFEARQLYLCLLDAHQPRRAAALLGLGNCFLQRAGTTEASSVLKAIDAYEQCVQAAKDDALRADAQHNLERARLLLHQIRKAEEERPPDKEPNHGNDTKPKPPNPQDHQPDHKPDLKPGGNQKPDGPGQHIKKDPGDNPMETNAPPPPGQGELRPVPDQPDSRPLSAEEAREHLRRATEEILDDRREHRKSRGKPRIEDVRNW